MSLNVGRVSDWYWRHQLGELLAQLEEGDLLEFDEGFYKHWAVYVGKVDGNPSVIHRTNHSGISGSSGSVLGGSGGTQEVCCQRLEEVLANRKVRINNSHDGERRPRTKRDILREAWAAVERRGKGEEKGGAQYCMLTNNCEHFAKGIRNETETSQQVQDGVATAAVTVGVGAVVLGAAMAIGSWLDGGGRQRERHEEKEPQRY